MSSRPTSTSATSPSHRLIARLSLALLAGALLTGLSLSTPMPARAALLPCEVAGVKPTADGGTLFELRCDLDGRGALADRVTIVSPTTWTGREALWPDVADTQNSVWLFDFGTDGNTELVISYRRDAQGLVAELYDAQGDPLRLTYSLDGSRFSFRSDLAPTVRVVAADGWWRRGDLINFNLEIQVDGLLDAAFDMRSKLRGHVETDGVTDFTIRIVDESGEGRPDYDWRTVRHPETQPRALQLTFLTINECDNEPPLEPMWPWPYFGPLTYGFLTANRHQVSNPPIQMSWEEGTLTTVGEFVSSRGNDCQWFVYSNEELQPGSPNRANFENPFSWYDLAADQDGQPELAVRLVYFAALDPLFVRGNFESPINVVRYSWDQNNDDLWDYKLGLLGSYPITSTVRAAGMDIASIPYDVLPEWVAERPWAVATFVAAEGVRARGEGIYTWDPSAWLTENYYTGLSNSPWPPEDVRAERPEDQLDLNHIPPGYRGDYQLELGEPATLYVSAVDRKLHLLNASLGSWNIDGESEMNYADRDGDGYVDEWQYSTNGELQQQLNVNGAYLIYSGHDEVVVKYAPSAPTLWQGPPPTDHEGWAELGEVLAPFEPDLRLPPLERLQTQIDLRRMIDRFEGEATELSGASVKDFRPDQNGFRFVLELGQSYTVAGDQVLDVRSKEPGSYLATHGSRLDIRALTGAQVSLSMALPRGQQVVAGLPVPVRVTTQNSGLEDTSNLILVGEAEHDEQVIEFARLPFSVLSHATEQLDLSFTGNAPGSWRLSVRLQDHEGNVLASTASAMTIAASRATGIGSVALTSTGGGWRMPAYALLFGTALLVAWAIRQAWPAAMRETEP